MPALYLNAALVATLPFEFLCTHLKNPLGQGKKNTPTCRSVGKPSWDRKDLGFWLVAVCQLMYYMTYRTLLRKY